MLTIRKGIKGEEQEILDTINEAFIPVRDTSFNIKNSFPKIYNNNLDYSKDHFVVLDNNKMVACAGNIIKDVTINNINYKYSLLGSVSTIPSYSNKGAMKLIMKEVDKENLNNEIVFSALSGNRTRYKYYGYEKAGQRFSFSFTSYFKEHYKSNAKLVINEFDSNLLDDYYFLYKKYKPLILRDKKDFEITLKRKDYKIYGIFNNNKLEGYFALSLSRKEICEITIIDASLVGSVVKSIMIKFNLDELKIKVNSLSVELIHEFDKVCEDEEFYNCMDIKVYKMKEFLQFLIDLNLKYREIADLEEIYKIDKDIYKITIKDNKGKVEIANNEFYQKQFTSPQFIRYAFNLVNLYLDKTKLFPLFLDINEVDLF